MENDSCLNCSWVLYGVAIGVGIVCKNPLNKNAEWVVTQNFKNYPQIPSRDFKCQYYDSKNK